jgi:subtilisin family serine protease
MRTILIIFCCLFFSQSEGQKIYKYYIYLDNSTSAPEFIRQGNYSIYVGKNTNLGVFFSNYQIISFSKAFPSSNDEVLSRILFLRTESSTLANDLLKMNPSVYLKYEDVTDVVYELQSDFGGYSSTSLGGNIATGIYMQDLDYINIKKAWDITSGIDITTGMATKIGISDAKINTTDADFAGNVSFVGGGSYQNLVYDPSENGINTYHGTLVAGIAAANGQNTYGSTGICYDCKIVGTSYSGGVDSSGNFFDPFDNLIALANAGVKVINMSWTTYSYVYTNQTVIDNLVARGVVLVAAAGNRNSYSTAKDYHCNQGGFTGIQTGYPASYNGVISVSGVYDEYPLLLPLTTSQSSYCCISPTNIPCYVRLQGSFGGTVDGTNVNSPTGLIFNGWPEACGTGISSPNGLVPNRVSNPDVDILAPCHHQFRFDRFAEVGTIEYTGGGTSSATPHVSGTVALMLTVNNCLLPNEVDNVLKLTSKDVEQLSFNQIYQGQIGAGALDAGNAVEFVNEMKKIDGNATIQNHIFYRFNFDLEKINNKLTIDNVTFKDNCIANFVAKSQINLKPGTDLKPNNIGSVNLKINPTLSVCNTKVAKMSGNQNSQVKPNPQLLSKILLYPNPNRGIFELSINNFVEFQNKTVRIDVIDINGRIIHEENVITDNNNIFNIPLNVSSITNGLYFVKVSSGEYIETLKFIKK